MRQFEHSLNLREAIEITEQHRDKRYSTIPDEVGLKMRVLKIKNQLDLKKIRSIDSNNLSKGQNAPESGYIINSKFDFPEGTILELAINTKTLLNDSMVLAHVDWVSRSEGSSLSKMGVGFIRTPEQLHEKLVNESELGPWQNLNN